MINNLAAYRKKANLKQKELAEKIGVGIVTLGKWESQNFNLRNLKVTTLENICEVLHIELKNLIWEE